MDLIKKLRHIFNRRQKLKYLAMLIITFIGATVETLGITIIMPFISVVIEPDYVFSQPTLSYVYNLLDLDSTNHFLMILAIGLIIVYLAKSAYLLFMYNFQYRFVYNNQMLMSVKLMTCYLNKSYEYHANKNSSEIVQGVTQDTANMFHLVLSFVLLCTEIMVVFCIGIVLIIIDPFISITTAILLLATIYIFIRTYRRKLKEAGIVNQKNYNMMLKWANQGVGGIKELKVVRREKYFINFFSDAAAKVAQSQRQCNFLGQVPKIFIEAICVSVILVIVAVILYSGRDMSVMIAQLAAFALAAFRIMPSFSRIANYYNLIIYYRPSIDKLYGELRGIGDDVEPITEIDECKVNLSQQYKDAIKIKDVSYKYPTADMPVLNKISFEIPLKKSIAIVGASGAGKTTLADIILGLLNPSSGQITVNELDIHKNKPEWSKKLGYIPQNIYLCDDSIRNNIAFGISEYEIDDERVFQAMEKAQLSDFVKSLPEGVFTEIGERGVRLSGGQRQRIGIARAFYNDPEILVLDEATSALDNDTETAVMDAINAVKNEKTLIIIAHRLSTIQNCDMIFKVEDGKVLLQE